MQLALSDYTTVEGAAKLIGVGTRRVNQLLDAGKLECFPVDARTRLVLKSAAKAYKTRRKK